MKQAVLLAAKYTLIAAAGFALLGLIMVYVPENRLIRESPKTELDDWMPDETNLPSGMIFVQEDTSTNAEIARNYPNQKEMLQLLEEFGRKEGYSRTYQSTNRCRQDGPRSLFINLVLLKDKGGAKNYEEWCGARDQEKVDQLEVLDIGDQGYWFTETSESQCSQEEKSISVRMTFQRNNVMATVEVTAMAGKNDEQGLKVTAINLSKVLDYTIQSRTYNNQ